MELSEKDAARQKSVIDTTEFTTLIQEQKGEIERRSEHLMEALRIVHAYSTARYDESVDITVVLNSDYKRSDERVRGTVLLPHGVGKTTLISRIAAAAALALFRTCDWVAQLC